MELKIGDEVWYTILNDEPRLWTITSLFDTHTPDGVVACLSRPDDTKKLKVDRCNAGVEELKKVKS